MSSSVPNVPMDPNLGAAQSGAMSNISNQAQYTPQFQQAYYNQASNPYAGQAVQGAQAGGQAMQAQGAQNLSNANYMSNIPQQLSPALQATLNTAYDPQMALYNQQHQANADYTNASLAQSGLSFTPWASGVGATSDQTFNTNWLQSQLGREQTGAATIAQLLGAGGTAAQTGAALGNQGATQIAQGAAMPYTAQTGINADTAQFLPYLTSNQQQQAQDYINYYGAATANTNAATQAGQANNQYASSIGSGLGSAAALGTMMYFSDEHMKEDIAPVGKTFDGQTIYRFRYRGQPGTQIGLLAGEVEQIYPEAVKRMSNGFRAVNYDIATRKAARYGV